MERTRKYVMSSMTASGLRLGAVFVRLAVTWILLAASGAAWADAESDLRASIQRQVSDAWAAGNFAALDEMADSFATSRARTHSGKWRLSIYFSALKDRLQIEWPKAYRLPLPGADCECGAPDPRYYDKADALWRAVDTKTGEWLAKRPGSPHAAVARAQYLSNRAWFYRGSAYAKYVPDEGWAQMRKYEGIEQDFLDEHSDARVRDPVWFEQMLNLAIDLGWTQGTFDDLVEDFKAKGGFYPDALQVVFSRLQPKWGGSARSMDRFARSVTEMTRAQEGGAMYARLYWNVAEGFPRTVFTEGGADWPTMRAGFADMVKQYPDPRNINGLGIFACMAGDYETMDKALASLGDKVQTPLWDRYIPYKECLALRARAAR